MTISVDFSATVTSGTSPLIVGFTSLTTSSATTNSKKIQNVWVFGDSAGDLFGNTTYSYGARPGVTSRVHGRNNSRGRNTSHCFEFVPGTGTHTYDVTLYSEYNGEWGSKTRTITVADPDAIYPTTSTICLSPSGDFTNAPTGSTHVTGSDVQAFITTYLANGKRLLLNRGESYTCNSTATIAVSIGQIHLGTYGSGSTKAYVSSTVGTGKIFDLSSGSTPDMADVKFVDWEVDGLSSGTNTIFMDGRGGCDFVHFVRMEWHDTTKTGIDLSSNVLHLLNIGGFPGHHLWTNWGFSDCYGHHAGQDFCYHGGSVDHADFVGSKFDNFDGGTGGATFRINAQSGSFVECDFARGHTSRQSFQIRALPFTSAQPTVIPDGTYTEKLSITSCKIWGNCPWSELIGSRDDIDGRIRDLEFDGNYYPNGTGTTLASTISATDVLRRNNLYQWTTVTGLAFAVAMSLEDDHPGTPASSEIHNYGDTLFENLASVTIEVHTVVHDSVGPVTNKNVLVNSTAGTTLAVLADDIGEAGWTDIYTASGNTNNSKNSSVGITTAQNFVGGVTPTTPDDFKLTSISPARGAGVACPELRLDYFGNWRWDDGATTDDRGFAVYDESLAPLWESVTPPPVTSVGSIALRSASLF